MSFSTGGIGGLGSSIDSFQNDQLNLFDAGDDAVGSFDINPDATSDLFNTEAPAFRQDFSAALQKISIAQNGINNVFEDLTEELRKLDVNTPMSQEEASELADKLLHKGLHLAKSAGSDAQTFLELQQAVLGLFKLITNYGNEDAAKHIGKLYGSIEETNLTKKQVHNKIIEWSHMEVFAFAAIGEDMNEAQKVKKTRQLQYLFFISIQLYASEETEFISEVASTDAIKEADALNDVSIRNTAGQVSYDDAQEIADAEKASIQITEVNSDSDTAAAAG
jgi:hypothetical protein